MNKLKMILILPVSLLAINSFASDCINLSGRYFKKADPSSFLKLEQTGCEKLVLENGTFKTSVLLDGACRSVCDESGKVPVCPMWGCSKWSIDAERLRVENYFPYDLDSVAIYKFNNGQLIRTSYDSDGNISETVYERSADSKVTDASTIECDSNPGDHYSVLAPAELSAAYKSGDAFSAVTYFENGRVQSKVNAEPFAIGEFTSFPQYLRKLFTRFKDPGVASDVVIKNVVSVKIRKCVGKKTDISDATCNVFVALDANGNRVGATWITDFGASWVYGQCRKRWIPPSMH